MAVVFLFCSGYFKFVLGFCLILTRIVAAETSDSNYYVTVLPSTTSTTVSACLCNISPVLLWARPPGGVAFRPRPLRSHTSSLVAILLLSIEPNPGPSVRYTASTELNFGYINICSAINKFPLIHDTIRDHQLDILALSETRLQQYAQSSVIDDIAPAGYSVQHVHRLSNANHPLGGGLALIHRSHLTTKTHPLSGTLSPSSFELQLIRLVTVKPPITVVNAYRPPSSSPTKFYDEFADALAAVCAATTDRVIICGDLNSPGSNSSSVSVGLAEVLDDLGFKQHVNTPTRTRPDNLLDVFATDSGVAVNTVKTDDAGWISDHRLVVASVAVRPEVHRPVAFSFRRIRDIDPADLESRLRQSSLFSAPATSAEAFADQLERVTTAVLDELAPMQHRTRRPPKTITKWLSSEAIAAKRERRQLERRWKSTRLEADRVRYRKSCRRTNTLINSSRRKYFCDKLSSAGDAKERWQAVKQMLHSADTPRSQPPDELRRLCRVFSNFFHDKIVKLKRNILSDRAASNPAAFPDPPYNGSEFSSVSPITVSAVSKLISSLPGKTSSADYIPSSLLKACPMVFSELISRLANLSFSDGIFPSKFKKAAVTPLIKKHGSDPDIPSNYRPISNLNNISKIIERLFLEQFQPHVTACPNFDKFQSAYRSNHSTETALLHTLNNIYSSCDDSQTTLLVSLDLSAAFDTIDHATLLSRLHTSFGITGSALTWLSSYLTNRYQSVRIGQATSSPVHCSAGVPQGSVLGPILFSIYTSPVGNIVSSHQISHQQYADDTQLYIRLTTSNHSTAIPALEHCITNLKDWFSANGLCLNPTKSESILFGTHQRLRSFPAVSTINVAGSPISLTDNLKTLGVTMDCNLTFQSHVSAVCKSSHYHLRALRHIRSSLTHDMAKTVAVSLVQSRLDYANSILYGTSEKNLQKLQRIQNTAAKIVLSGSHTDIPSTKLLSDLHWLPVRQRIQFKLATITYNVVHHAQPFYLHSLLSSYSPSRNLRSADKFLLFQPRVKTSIGSRSYSHSAPILWNSIPLSIRSSQTIATFKKNLKTFYFFGTTPRPTA